MQTVEQYRVLDLVLEGTSEGNPYVDITLTAQFERADGTDAVEVRGFYRGAGRYGIRFMPRAAGTWTYRTSSNDPALSGITGEVEVTPASEGNHGRVLLTKDVKRSDVPFDTRGDNTFSYEDGTRFLPFGTTAYAWTNQEPECQDETVKTLAAAPFNKIRMCIFPKFYDFNTDDPAMYAFEGSLEDGFDHTRFFEPFWENLDHRLAQLDELGIQADIILLHPYDKPEWGFSKMTREEDAFYLAYVARRYSAFRNVWWSLANEFDLMPWKSVEDWDSYARIVMANDPYGHLRSIHNCRTIFDHSHPWITHVSWQRCDLQKTAECVTELREQYHKPVLVDEVGYEGNVTWVWQPDRPGGGAPLLGGVPARRLRHPWRDLRGPRPQDLVGARRQALRREPRAHRLLPRVYGEPAGGHGPRAVRPRFLPGHHELGHRLHGQQLERGYRRRRDVLWLLPPGVPRAYAARGQGVHHRCGGHLEHDSGDAARHVHGPGARGAAEPSVHAAAHQGDRGRRVEA